jgi:hypothetical protein
MLKVVTLQYRNKKYKCRILANTENDSHFYWLLCDDPEFKKITNGEDSVCFQQISGELVCTSLLLRVNIPALVDTARDIIQQHVQR